MRCERRTAMTEARTFSKKQLQVLTWWHDRAPTKDCDALICDGAVRSGKTTCMALSFVAWAFFRFSGCAFALCGKTITCVRRNVLVPLLGTLETLGFTVREQRAQNVVTLTLGGRSNRFYLFGGRDAASASLIQGMTLHGVFFDEVALMPRAFVEQALARCSPAGAKFWFNCNPDHPLHWFHTEWIKKADEKNALYLHFLMNDNPSLSPEIIARYERLYSGAFYDRFVRGLWVAAEGLIYPEAAAGAYTKTPPAEPADDWYISCDYGTVNPCSMGLWAKHGAAWYRVAEFYHDSRRAGTQKTDEEYYADLVALAGTHPISGVIVDPSAASFLTCIRRHGVFRAIPAKNDVIEGIRAVQQAFRSGALFVSPDCTDTLREFSLYAWDLTAGTDRVKKEFDHAMDDLRSFVATVLTAPQDGFFAMAHARR